MRIWVVLVANSTSKERGSQQDTCVFKETMLTQTNDNLCAQSFPHEHRGCRLGSRVSQSTQTADVNPSADRVTTLITGKTPRREEILASLLHSLNKAVVGHNILHSILNRRERNRELRLNDRPH